MNYTIADRPTPSARDGHPAPIDPLFWRSKEWRELVADAKTTLPYCAKCKRSLEPEESFVLLKQSGFEAIRSGSSPTILDCLCLCPRCNKERRRKDDA